MPAFHRRRDGATFGAVVRSRPRRCQGRRRAREAGDTGAVAGPSAPLTRTPGAEPTEPPPLDAASAAPEEVTARTLFREADAARAAGDTALALRTLRALVERFPRESGGGGRTLRAGAHGSRRSAHEDAALRHLAAVDTPALEEPTEYLRCRVLAKRTAVGTAEAERCLADFRRRFPASAHDADALATETALALARGGCPAAQALLTELERRHPAHGSAARLRAACRPPAVTGSRARWLAVPRPRSATYTAAAMLSWHRCRIGQSHDTGRRTRAGLTIGRGRC